MPTEFSHIGYNQLHSYNDETLIKMSEAYFIHLNSRRSLRFFSEKPVPEEVIENIIMAASTAPSGANKQPWTFCVVSSNDLKKQIRIAAEEEELKSYSSRMSEEWLEDLKPLATDWKKQFLEIAPYLIIVFKRVYEIDSDGKKHQNYYVHESVGLACGFLLTAIHELGLVALTHTPSPMDFLTKILNRPSNERPFLLIPVGYPAKDATVPDIKRKEKDNVLFWYK
ncbi:nitroreductase family protein [Emticicia sp. SJ17W-69]|uniref:nitroreductase family protein n=1 Tax=Emticicia sp. SJ17W-69 TaxID=3421657 RepID=UPI003EB769AD